MVHDLVLGAARLLTGQDAGPPVEPGELVETAAHGWVAPREASCDQRQERSGEPCRPTREGR